MANSRRPLDTARYDIPRGRRARVALRLRPADAARARARRAVVATNQ